ncbi:hypothetical protein RJ641_018121 [Dillenia turbinata]|uniref:Uncharacterized protein n=1 Tax=Dillenia turbinata TaxID=194707 RepID=A0AAN8YYZ0_9MAGN
MLPVWKLWNDNVPFDLVDSTIRDSFSRNNVLRSIHIGLLCVKEDPIPLPQLPDFTPQTRPELELNLSSE